MTAFRVDLAALEALIERMALVESQLVDVHDDVSSRMRHVHVAWSGRAAAEHQAAYQQWVTGSGEVREALERLREVARTAHGNYTAAVVANRAMWGS